MTGIGSDIGAVDYVTIQDKAQLLLGTGTGSRGYGQTVQSADVFTGNQITKEQWDLLRYDITSIKYHQDGALPNIVTVNVGDVIGYGSGNPNTNYATLLADADANRFKISPSASTLTNKGAAVRSTPWSVSASATLTCTFSDSNAARYFFNSGGKIRITTTITGASVSSQINAWVGLLNTIGTVSFGAATHPTLNYYTLTNSYQTMYQNSLSTPYSANYFSIEAKCDVANNSTGTATVVYIKITLNDSYVDPDVATGKHNLPDDVIDGTLTISVDELKATGSLTPSGSFTIASPTYSLSSITAS